MTTDLPTELTMKPSNVSSIAISAADVSGLRPLTFACALALTFGASTVQAGMDAAVLDRWHGAVHDPRFHQLALMPIATRERLALDYGLRTLLERQPDGTTLPVTSCADSGAGSLRDVIATAPTGSTVDASALVCSTITLGGGEIVIAQDDLTVKGPGRSALTVNSKYGGRIFHHTGHGTLTLTALSIGGGRVSGVDHADGGCLYSEGSIALGNIFYAEDSRTGVVVSNCKATSNADGISFGGAIYAFGTVAMTNSVVSGSEATGTGSNQRSIGGGVVATSGLAMKYSEVRDNIASGADGSGGGIYVYRAHGDVSIRSSTISDNTASGTGGGLFSYAYSTGTTYLYNSTVSRNRAADSAGMWMFVAAAEDGDRTFVNLYNSTVTANVSTTYSPGSGLTVFYSDVDLQSSIISGNFKGSTVPDDTNFLQFSGQSLLGNNNFIGVATGGAPDDTRYGTDPQLTSLGSHGGRTRTHLPRAGSPVIDGGNNNNDEDFDQRGSGFPRVVGLVADIGATEYDPDYIFADGVD